MIPNGGNSKTVSRVVLAALAALLIALGVAARWLDLPALFGAALAWTEGLGLWGEAIFIALYAIATVLLLPAFILTLGAGAVYGVVHGALLVSIGATLGATAAFLAGRYLARDWVAKRIAEDTRFQALDDAVAREGWKIVGLTRLSPAIPFVIQNYAYGLTRVSSRDYVLASWIGMTPGILMYVYLGSLAGDLASLGASGRVRTPAEWALYAVGLLATVAVTVYVTRLARGALQQRIATMPSSRPLEQIGRSRGGSVDVRASPIARRVRENSTARALDRSTESFRLEPWDAHNQALVRNVRPPDWVNPDPAKRYNLVVIGAGAAGLVSAIGAAGLGAKVALVERHLLGGDCLNVGCVPSKALLRAARAAADVRDAAAYGVQVPPGAGVDFFAVMERMRALRAQISRADSARRCREAGVDVFLGEGRFTGPDTVEVDGKTLRFARAVIATGARAAAPPIPGLAEAGYLTNETVWSLTALPRRLAVIGAGPIGCELAQAFARFGSQVHLIEAQHGILPNEDRDGAEIVLKAMARDGVALLCCGTDLTVTRGASGKCLTVDSHDRHYDVEVDEILVGVGRRPNVEGLGLDKADVSFDQKGIVVNDRLQTTNPRIFAAGDICPGYKFTHNSDFQARLVIQNALFHGRGRASALTMPWCTYTDPEVAHVGLYERDAAAKGIRIRTFTQELIEVDRAILDGETDGFVRVHVREGTDAILGATIVARHAGEMLSEVTLAIKNGVGLGKIAATIHPYPTQGEAIRKLGDAYNRTRLTPFVKRLFTRWLAWTR